MPRSVKKGPIRRYTPGEEGRNSSEEQRPSADQDLVTSFNGSAGHGWTDDCHSQWSAACAGAGFGKYGWPQAG